MLLLVFLLTFSTISHRMAIDTDYGEIVFKMPNFGAFSVGKEPEPVFSGEVIINGRPWTIRIEYNGKYLAFHTCIQIEWPDFAWHCKFGQQLSIVSSKQSVKYERAELNDYKTLNANSSCWGYDEFIEFTEVMSPEKGFYDEREDAVTFKAQVKAQMPKGLLQIRAEHSLLVNGKLVHVNKYILAAQSEFFKNLFFGQKDETPNNEMPQIQIEGIENAVENFKQLISVVNSPNAALTDDSAERVRQLANRFEMKSVGIDRTRGQILFKMANFRAFSEDDTAPHGRSDKVSIDGMSWYIGIIKSGNFLSIYLRCDGDKTDSNWSRELASKFVVVSPTKGDTFVEGDLRYFNAYDSISNDWGRLKFESFEALMDPQNGAYDPREDTMTFKCEFIVKKRKEPYQAYTFEAEDNLRVNGQAVKVNKFLLAAHSPLFQEFFFELNSANGTPNIPIDGMENAVEKFRKLILFVNSPNAELDDDCVENVLLLADRFQLDSVVNRCVNFLMTKSERSMLNKFKLAKRCKIIGMEKSILKGIEYGELIIAGKDIANLLENLQMDSDKMIDELIY